MKTTHEKECTNFNRFINKLKEEMEKDKVILPRCRTFTFRIIDRLVGEYRKSTQDAPVGAGSGMNGYRDKFFGKDRQNKPNRNDCLCCKGICDCEYGCSHVHKELDANQDGGEKQ